MDEKDGKMDEFRNNKCGRCGRRGRICLAILPSSSVFLSEEEKKPRKVEYVCVECQNKRHTPEREEVTPILSEEAKVLTPSLFRRMLRWFLRLFGFSIM